MNPVKPTFERLADSTIQEVTATYAQRGAQYGDSWAGSQWNTVGALCNQFQVQIPGHLLRAFALAFLVDVKYNRHKGGFKRDTLIDSIAYQAALAQEVEDLLAGSACNAKEDIEKTERLIQRCQVESLYKPKNL